MLIEGVWDPPPLTLENLVIYYETVVLATVIGYGAPFWSTTDRLEPSLSLLRSGSVDIRTPLLVRDSELIRGQVHADGIVIGHHGKIGCVEFTAVTFIPEVGQEYVLFLGSTSDVWVAWPVNGGVAQTEYDGDIALSELSARLDAAASATPR